jgi:dTDP-4-dehydrorhamnose 3,5-epimerase
MSDVLIRLDGATVDGVQVIRLPQFQDERGGVYRMLRVTDPHFVEFGEIYFSTVYPGVIKAWKRHHLITVNYACIYGTLKLVLWDDRVDSPTCGVFQELVLGPESNYSLVVVPPGVWNGFQGISEPLAMLANCATGVNDAAEFDRLEPHTKAIPYVWGR